VNSLGCELNDRKFDFRELKKYGIAETAEGSFRHIIYNKKVLAEHLRYLKTTPWEGIPQVV
jgi:hypothetical protein